MSNLYSATRIYIGGVEVKPSECSILFVWEDGEYIPVLYKEGKRVIDSYRILITHEQTKDEYGASA